MSASLVLALAAAQVPVLPKEGVPQPLFPARQFAATGGNTQILATGDLNLDGLDDLIAGGANDNEVSVLLGAGDGTFGAPIVHSRGTFLGSTNPSAVAVLDLDGNGNPDVVVGGQNPAEAQVWLGDGTGALAYGSGHAVDHYASDLAAGDLDGDGVPDLAVASSLSASVSFLLGDGAGGFGGPAVSDVGSAPQSIALADLDLDGDLDAVGASTAQQLAVLFGDGAGGVSSILPQPVAGPPADLVLADVDADGAIDALVALGGIGGEVGLLFGDGSGTLGGQVDFDLGADPGTLRLGDVTGDGLLDIVAGKEDETFTVLAGDGAGGFAERGTFGPASIYVTLGDFDANGVRDIATTGGDFLTVYLGLGLGDFLGASQVDGGSVNFVQSAAVGDLDGDGRADVARGGHSTNTVGVSLGAGDGTFAFLDHFSTGWGPLDLSLGDLSGDGVLDALTANENTDDLTLLFGDGTGRLPVRVDVATGGLEPVSAGLADLDADGRLDVVAANRESDDLSVLLGAGAGGLTAPTIYPAAGGEPRSLAFGDLDLDGALDVAAGSEAFSSRLSILLGDGAGGLGATAELLSSQVGACPLSIALDDVDGDGFLDLLAANEGRDNVSVFRGDGLGGFPTETIYPLDAERPEWIAVADLNADGAVDVATANKDSSSPNAAVLLGDGAGGFGPALHFAARKFDPGFATTADLDVDGRVDLVTAQRFDGTATVHLGTRALEPAGTLFGTGTAGCRGRLAPVLGGPPAVGSVDFGIGCTNAPPRAPGVALLAGAGDPAGNEPPGLGVLVHVQPATLLFPAGLPVQADAGGTAFLALPLPADPALAGEAFHAQFLFEEPLASSCSPSPARLVSSRGLRVTVTP
ncbi:MAG: VCBS repeat-containing protein [Planctomycetota bacterium]